MKNNNYNAYQVSFLTFNDALVDSLPFFSRDDDTAIDCVERCGARNCKTASLWHIGVYDVARRRFRNNKCTRLVKCLTYNLSQAAEAATPQRKEKRIAERSVA